VLPKLKAYTDHQKSLRNGLQATWPIHYRKGSSDNNNRDDLREKGNTASYSSRYRSSTLAEQHTEHHDSGRDYKPIRAIKRQIAPDKDLGGKVSSRTVAVPEERQKAGPPA
jgi:hypothetical protein